MTPAKARCVLAEIEAAASSAAVPVVASAAPASDPAGEVPSTPVVTSPQRRKQGELRRGGG